MGESPDVRKERFIKSVVDAGAGRQTRRKQMLVRDDEKTSKRVVSPPKRVSVSGVAFGSVSRSFNRRRRA